MSNQVQPDEPYTRAIVAVVEGAIDEFGVGGLDRLCFFQICKPFAQHFDDPVYLAEYELWISVVCAVCTRRGIVFDAWGTCEKFTDSLWERELGISLD